MADSDSVSVHFNAEEVERILKPFDELVEAEGGNRSAHLKSAMAIYVGARLAGKDLRTDHRNTEMDLIQWTRYALLEYERERNPDEVLRRLTENR